MIYPSGFEIALSHTLTIFSYLTIQEVITIKLYNKQDYINCMFVNNTFPEPFQPMEHIPLLFLEFCHCDIDLFVSHAMRYASVCSDCRAFD